MTMYRRRIFTEKTVTKNAVFYPVHFKNEIWCKKHLFFTPNFQEGESYFAHSEFTQGKCFSSEILKFLPIKRALNLCRQKLHKSFSQELDKFNHGNEDDSLFPWSLSYVLSITYLSYLSRSSLVLTQ